MLISLFLLHTVFLASHPLIVGLRSLHVVKKVQNSLLDSVGEGEGGMIWENGIETCITSYEKQIASPGSMHDVGCSGLVHWDDPEGWCGEGVQDGNMFTPVADSC